MNLKLLALPLAAPAVLIVSSALFSGCEVCTGEDCPDFDGIGGFGGNDDNDDGSGGGDTDGGTGGDVGAGGMGGGAGLVIECSDVATGTAGSCEPDENATGQDLTCQECVRDYCCAEQEACNSYEPEQACAWGSVLVDGSSTNEIGCMMNCFADLNDQGQLDGTQQELEECSAQCGALECGGGGATEVTNDLAGCLLGTQNDDDPDNDGLGCQLECGWEPE